MKSRFANLTFFPHFLYLLPLFFVLHGYLENYPAVPLMNGLWLLVKYWAFAAVLVGLFYLLLRSVQRAAIMTFFIMAVQFFFGPVHDGLKAALPETVAVRYTFLLPVIFLAAAVLLVYLKKKKPAFPTLFSYLSLLLVVLIVIDLFTLGARQLSAPKKEGLATTFSACDTCAKPDVFLLIADSYSGRVPLEEVFRFDNSAFESALRQRGFYLVDSSLSNYNYTPFTMASMLGMQYLYGLEGHNKSLNDRKICYGHIDENPVTDFFGRAGYDFKNFSIFKFAGQLPIVTTSFYKAGEDLIKSQTLLARIDRDIRYHLVTSFGMRSEMERLTYEHRKLNERLYTETWREIKAPTTTGPRFIYTHIEMPHYPYYYDKAGRPAAFDDLQEEKQRDTANYLQYLQYGNIKYLQLIDHILANAKQPPIILFMSDHAFREYPGDAVDHRYHFMNLNSIYLPKGNYSGFYNGISTVNQFRVLLNSAFGQTIPLLKDSTSYLLE